MADMVNRPPHYNEGGVEAIDAIRAALGEDGFKAYCRGNAIKYLWRCEHKGKSEEDMDKAIWYTRMANGDDPRNGAAALGGNRNFNSEDAGSTPVSLSINHPARSPFIPVGVTKEEW